MANDAKTRVFWVSRDKAPLDGDLEIWFEREKPKLDNGKEWNSPHNYSLLVCCSTFLIAFGFLPEAGDCVKVKFTVERLRPSEQLSLGSNVGLGG